MPRNDSPRNHRPRNAGSGWSDLDTYLSAVNEAFIGGLESVYGAGAAVTDPMAEFAYRKLYGDAAADRLMEHVRNERRYTTDAASRTFVSQPNPIARTVGRVGAGLAMPVPKAIPGRPFINWLTSQGNELTDLLNQYGGASGTVASTPKPPNDRR